METKILFQRTQTEAKAEKICPAGHVVVPMRGYSRWEDFYLIIPKIGLYTRAANATRYGEYKYELFIDGSFIGATRMDKIEKVKMLYSNGFVEEAIEYSRGHMLWRETKLGGGKINKYKEAARISHRMCDSTGANGHNIRQRIRADILFN